MFAAPPVHEAELFASLPPSLRLTDRDSGWAFGKGGRLHSFLEGPAYDRQGRLYVTDIPYGRIFRIDSTGQFELFVEYDAGPMVWPFTKMAACSSPTTSTASWSVTPRLGKFVHTSLASSARVSRAQTT